MKKSEDNEGVLESNYEKISSHDIQDSEQINSLQLLQNIEVEYIQSDKVLDCENVINKYVIPDKYLVKDEGVDLTQEPNLKQLLKKELSQELILKEKLKRDIGLKQRFNRKLIRKLKKEMTVLKSQYIK
ncbi:hypothetical protein [Marinicellulosiphila megalodicopiae]|uniref:hypothetical protein n=1 Tax=Marinicellulosiphila megalodicopiae TaxID=2724896 RepID=UPI003BAE8D23